MSKSEKYSLFDDLSEDDTFYCGNSDCDFEWTENLDEGSEGFFSESKRGQRFESMETEEDDQYVEKLEQINEMLRSLGDPARRRTNLFWSMKQRLTRRASVLVGNSLTLGKMSVVKLGHTAGVSKQTGTIG